MKLITIISIFVSFILGGIFFYFLSESDFSLLDSIDEEALIDLEEVDDAVNTDALKVLEDIKLATNLMEQESVNISSDIAQKSLPFSEYINMIDTVFLFEEFKELLNPDKFNCGFGKKMRNNIKQRKDWLPEQIKFEVNDSIKYKKAVLKFNESSAAYIFNLINITFENPETGKDSTIRVVPEGSLLFSKEKVFTFLNEERNSFIVNFDCDGYYKAAVSFGLGGGRGKLRASANASQNRKISAFFGMGYVYSPLQYIMEPSSTPIIGSVKQYERFSHLSNILALSRILDLNDFKVSPTSQIKMVWGSNSGENTLNNRASISASANVGVISGNAEGGINIKRGATYSNFNSYLIGRVNSIVGSYDKNDIAKKMSIIFSSIELENQPKWIDRDLVFSIRLNEEYCNNVEGTWKIKETGFSLDKMISEQGDRNLCNCTVDGDISSTARRITLEGKIENQDVSRVIDLPLIE